MLRIARNSIAILSVQGVNLLTPLIIFPMIAQRMGLNDFGRVSFLVSVTQISILIIDFGFSLSFVEMVSKCKEGSHRVRKLISAILLTRLLVSIVIFAIFALYFNAYKPEFDLEFVYLMMLSTVIASMQMFWFFTAIERVFQYSVLTALSKVVQLLYINAFVLQSTDMPLIGWSFVIAQLIVCIGGLILMTMFGYRLRKVKTSTIKLVFLKSVPYFWSRASFAIYTAGSSFILGASAQYAQLAIYAACEQIYKVLQTIVASVSQAVYPIMVKRRDFNLLRKLILINFCAAIVVIIPIGLYGEYILAHIFGEEFNQGIWVLRAFLVIFLVTGVSVFIGYPLFVPLNKAPIANKSIVIGGVLQLFILTLLYLTGNISVYSVLFAVFLAEFSVLAYRFYYGFTYLSIGYKK